MTRELLNMSYNSHSEVRKKEIGNEDFALRNIKVTCSKPYYASLLCITIHYISAVNEFQRFLKYVYSYQEPGKSQLLSLKYPIFVHFYLVLLQHDEAKNAQAFHKYFLGTFKDDKCNEANIKELYNLQTPENVKSHSYFKTFWKEKFHVELSADVLNDLVLYLQDNESISLCYILHLYFYFNEDNALLSLFYANSENGLRYQHSKIQSFDEDWFENIQESCIPPIKAVTFQLQPDFLNISCVELNEDATQIFAAVGKSYIIASEKQGDEYVVNEDKNYVKDDDPVYSIKYLPIEDKSLLLKASSNKVSVLNTETMMYEKEDYDHDHCQPIYCMDVESSATLFATASADGSSSLVDLTQYTILQNYDAHKEPINVVKFHPSGIYFATGSSDTTLRLWAINGVTSSRWFCHKSSVYTCEFSPCGKYLASAGTKGTIKIWDLKDGSKFFEISCSDEKEFDMTIKVTSICFNYDGSLLAACYAENKLGVTDVENRFTVRNRLKLWNLNLADRNNSPKLADTVELKNCPLFVKFLKTGELKVVLQAKETESLY